MIRGKFLAAVSKRKVEMLGNSELSGMPVLGSRYIPVLVFKKRGGGKGGYVLGVLGVAHQFLESYSTHTMGPTEFIL